MRFFAPSKNYTVGAVTVVQIPAADAVNSAGTGLSGGGRALIAFIEVQTVAIWFTLDGSTPSAANGYSQLAGTRLELKEFYNITQVKFLSQGGTANLYVTFAN